MKRENNIFPLQTDAGKAGNDELIKMLEEKIRWYMLEASEEAFDTDELDAMVTLLGKLQQTPEPTEEETAEAWKKFQAYYETRMEEERVLEAAINAEAEESETTESGKETIAMPGARKKNMLRNLWVAVGAAACLVIAVLISSGLGEVNAGEGNGFFNWLKMDVGGTVFVTSPGNEDGEKIEKYHDIQEVPDELQAYIQQMEEIPCLNEYELKEIGIYDNVLKKTISGMYVLEDNQITVCAKLYKQHTLIAWDQYGEYQQYDSMTDEKIGLYTFMKVNDENQKEYFVSFNCDNIRYDVSGVVDLEFLIQVAREYMKIIDE